MLTGISGSKIEDNAVTIWGLNFSVVAGSGTSGIRDVALLEGAGSPAVPGINGITRAGSAASFCGDDILPCLERRAQRMPRQTGALHTDRILANTREDDQ